MALRYVPTAADFEADPPALAIRRHTDRCFFAVEEVIAAPDGSLDGFVVEGHRIAPEDVAEVRRTGGVGLPPCTRGDR